LLKYYIYISLLSENCCVNSFQDELLSRKKREKKKKQSSKTAEEIKSLGQDKNER